jgi:predicted dehydrogenase
MIKIGIIGAGAIAEDHLRVLETFNDVSIVAISNRSKDRLDFIKDKYDIGHSYLDYNQMIKEIKLDAIFVTVSLFNLTEVTSACLESGIPTFIEKPVGLSTQDIESLIIISNSNKTINMVGLNRRFYSNILNAFEIIKKDGGVRTILIDAPQRISDINHWKGFESKTNIWNGIHCIDLFRFFCGEIEYLNADVKNNNNNKFNDTFNSMIKFKNNSVGHFISNWCAEGKWSVILVGNSKRVNIQPLENGHYFDKKSNIKDLKVSKEDINFKPGFYYQDRFFIDSIISKSTINYPASDLNDYYNTMKLACEINSGGYHKW